MVLLVINFLIEIFCLLIKLVQFVEWWTLSLRFHVRQLIMNIMPSLSCQAVNNGAYGSGWSLSISCESGMTLHLNGYVCLLMSMPRERANSVSFAALEPTVHTASIASASPFLLMRMTLAPPYCWSNNRDPLSPHFSLIRSGISSRRVSSYSRSLT